MHTKRFISSRLPANLTEQQAEQRKTLDLWRELNRIHTANKKDDKKTKQNEINPQEGRNKPVWRFRPKAVRKEKSCCAPLRKAPPLHARNCEPVKPWQPRQKGHDNLRLNILCIFRPSGVPLVPRTHKQDTAYMIRAQPHKLRDNSCSTRSAQIFPSSVL